MYYEWHNKYFNKEISLFLTILNYFRQILVAFKYFVQSDWRIIVKNLELPYNVKLKTQFVTDRVLSWFKVGFVLLNLQFSVKFFVDHCLSFCPFSFRHCMPALLRFMTSDNSFGIYKLFLSVDLYTHRYAIPIIKFISL